MPIRRPSWRRTGLLSAALLLSCARGSLCSEPPGPVFGPAIWGGTTLDSGDPLIRAVVKLRESVFCTGVLVAPDAVLTSAHCLPSVPVRVAVESVGGDLPAPACGKSAVAEAALPPGSRTDSEDGKPMPDIVLLRLETPLCGAVPAALPEDEGPPLPGELLQVSGFGVGSPSGWRPDSIGVRTLGQDRAAAAALFDDASPATAETARRYLEHYGDDYAYAVPAASGSGICPGDSGSPVYRLDSGRVVLKGVAGAALPHDKKGAGCATSAYLVLYVPLAPHAGWVRETLERWALRPSGAVRR